MAGVHRHLVTLVLVLAAIAAAPFAIAAVLAGGRRAR